MRADIHNVTQAAARGDAHAVSALLQKDRALANVTGDGGWAPLHLAAKGGHANVAKLLLEHGANVHLRANNRLESRPLHTAAASGQAKVAEVLLDHKANVNSSQRGGVTALHLAAENGDLELVRLLVERGAEISARTESGLTPLDLALSRGHGAVAELLRQRGGLEP
jgi:uncharacterized protein